MEERLSEDKYIPWSKSDRQFHFIRSQIVVFNTGNVIQTPSILAERLPGMSSSSVYYHFIDARRRLPDGLDDFRQWLLGFGDTHNELIEELAGVDPYFESLSALRQRLALVFRKHLGQETGESS